MNGTLRTLVRRSRRADGFTLVEMLVGLTLFALLSILLFGGFRFGLRAWEVGGAQAAAADEIQLVQDMLRRQIAVAQPAAALGTTAVAPAISGFAGDRDSLAFVAAMPLRTGAAGLYRFELGEAADGAGRQLRIGWMVFRLDQAVRSVSSSMQHDVLLSQIGTVRFGYFGHGAAGQAPQWLDAWDPSWGLPQLVRVSLDFPAGDPRIWPDLVVAPRLRGAGQ